MWTPTCGPHWSEGFFGEVYPPCGGRERYGDSHPGDGSPYVPYHKRYTDVAAARDAEDASALAAGPYRLHRGYDAKGDLTRHRTLCSNARMRQNEIIRQCSKHFGDSRPRLYGVVIQDDDSGREVVGVVAESGAAARDLVEDLTGRPVTEVYAS